MSRLYDRLVSGGVAAFSGDLGPQRREDVAGLLAGPPVLVLDDLTRRFYEVVARRDGKDGGGASAGGIVDELPNLRPPGLAPGHAFFEAYFEAKTPRLIPHRGGNGEIRKVYSGDLVPRAWGVPLRVTDLKERTGGGEGWREEAREDARRTLARIGTKARLVTDVRWFYQGTLYVEDAPFTRPYVGRKVVGPLAYLFLAVREDGTPARALRGGRETGEAAPPDGPGGAAEVAVRGAVALLGEAGKRSPELLGNVGMAAMGVLEQVSLAVALANCRGVEPVRIEPSEKLVKKAKKRNKNALAGYRTLDVAEMWEVLVNEGGLMEAGFPAALGRCRDHWRADGAEGATW